MKPWEETWMPYPEDTRCIVKNAGDTVVADILEPLRENGREAAALIAAAPEMARAILAALNGEAGWQKGLEAAARKAGLPVPE